MEEQTGEVIQRNEARERILAIIREAPNYIATWGIAAQLGIAASEFRTRLPRTIFDQALDELIEDGLIEEVPNLALRYQVKRR